MLNDIGMTLGAFEWNEEHNKTRVIKKMESHSTKTGTWTYKKLPVERILIGWVWYG